MDVNQAFDDIFLAEEIAQQSGYYQGLEIGKSSLFAGYHLGFHKASLLSAQLGFYSGTLLLFLDHKSDKIASFARNLSEQINKFPKNNDENTDMKAAFEDVKSKYQKFCTLVKINSSYPEADKLEF